MSMQQTMTWQLYGANIKAKRLSNKVGGYFVYSVYMNLYLHPSPFIFIHLPSSSSIFIHLPLSSFINIIASLVTFMANSERASEAILLTLLFTGQIEVYYCILLYTTVYYYILLYTTIYYYILLYTTNYILLYTTTISTTTV